jgi:hypothetical protein
MKNARKRRRKAAERRLKRKMEKVEAKLKKG